MAPPKKRSLITQLSPVMAFSLRPMCVTHNHCPHPTILVTAGLKPAKPTLFSAIRVSVTLVRSSRMNTQPHLRCSGHFSAGASGPARTAGGQAESSKGEGTRANLRGRWRRNGIGETGAQTRPREAEGRNTSAPNKEGVPQFQTRGPRTGLSCSFWTPTGGLFSRAEAARSLCCPERLHPSRRRPQMMPGTSGQNWQPGLLFASPGASPFSASNNPLPEKFWTLKVRTALIVTRGLHKRLQMAKPGIWLEGVAFAA